MDLSGGLYTLPSEALQILRYFTTIDTEAAHTDAIIDGTGLTDRGFGKGIRRLVTRNYLTLSGEQVYRLTEPGRRAVNELRDQGGLDDEDDLDLPEIEDEPRFVRRRLILVTPSVLAAEQPMNIALGFDDPDPDDRLDAPSNLLIRLGVVNGEPQRSQEVLMSLGNTHIQRNFEITAGAFTQARVRAEVFQTKENEDDFEFCGGMHVDLPVSRTLSEIELTPIAYGIDILLREM